MREQLDNPSDWTPEHLERIAELLDRLQRLRLDMIAMQARVR